MNWVNKDAIYFRGPRAFVSITGELARALDILRALNAETYHGARIALRAMSQRFPDHVPSDAAVVGLLYDPCRNHFRLLLEHPVFEERFGVRQEGMEHPTCFDANMAALP